MVVIGAGRVGTSLAKRAEEHGEPVVLVRRDEGWEDLERTPGPILVAVRNDDLDGVVQRIPPWRREDLVFVQNGMIRPWLEANGLATATRGLLFFAAPRRDGEIEPGAESPFCGPHAARMVRWFGWLDLPARELRPQMFAELELEKLIWNAAFGVLCDAYRSDVGTICGQHRAELQELVAEMNTIGRIAIGVDLEIEGLIDRLVAYSMTIPTWRAAVKEWGWRNGWFVDMARLHGVAMPVHERLLDLAMVRPRS